VADLQLTLDPLVPPAGVLPHQRLDQRCYLDADGRQAFLVATCPLPPDQKEPGAPDPKVLRQALFAWAFNPATRDITPPPHIAAALDGAERASLAVTYLEDTANVRLALAACAATLAGKPAAGSTQRRKRSVSYNALGYAVELGRLGSNPVDRIQWTAPAVAASVDRRVVVSPAQAGTLLDAVGRLRQRGEHLKTFFATQLLRGAAPVGGCHAPPGRPAPAQDPVGTDPPGYPPPRSRAAPGTGSRSC
jgi:hypothetical protein